MSINKSILDSTEQETFLVGGFETQSTNSRYGFPMALRFPKNMVNSDMFKEPVFLNDVAVWDIKNQKYIGDLNDDTENSILMRILINDVLDGPKILEDLRESSAGEYIEESNMAFLESNEYTRRLPASQAGKDVWYYNRIQYIMKNPGFSSFVADMKNGRYKKITNEEFEAFAGKGNTHHALTKAKIAGEVFEAGDGSIGITVSSVEGIVKLEMPAVYKSPGKSYDFIKYLKPVPNVSSEYNDY